MIERTLLRKHDQDMISMLTAAAVSKKLKVKECFNKIPKTGSRFVHILLEQLCLYTYYSKEVPTVNYMKVGHGGHHSKIHSTETKVLFVLSKQMCTNFKHV